MRFRIFYAAIATSLALAGPGEILVVDISRPDALQVLRKVGARQFGRIGDRWLLAAEPQMSEAVAQSGFGFTAVPLRPHCPTYIAFVPNDDVMNRVQKLAMPLFRDGQELIVQMDEKTALEVALAGAELVRLPDEPFPVSPVSEPKVPRVVFPDTFVERLVAGVNPDSIRARMSRLQAFRTRYSPADSCRAAEEFIANWFRAIGLDSVELVSYPVGSDTWRNVVGTIVGRTHPEKILIICGHMDAISEDPWNLAPGMEDNGSGTAVMLEAARVLAGEELDLTVKFIAFTGEEEGLYGSDHYARMMRTRNAEILAVLNFDMVSWPGGAWGVALVSVLPARQLVLLEAAMADLYTTLDHRISHRSFPSDSRSFDNVGYPATSAYEFGPEPYIWYHTTGDTLGNCNMALAAEVAKMAVATIATLAVAPIPPDGFVLRDCGNGTSLVAAWRPNTEPDLLGYKLRWGTESYIYSDSVLLGPVTSFRLSGLVQGRRYYATVVAIDSCGHESGPANQDSASPQVVPAPPAGVSALPFHFGMAVFWQPSREADLAGYNIYRSTLPDSNYQRLNQGLLTDTTYRDSGLLSDTMYYYAVTAVDSLGNESPFSARVRGKPLTFDHGILLVDETRDGTGARGNPSDEQQDRFYHALLEGFRYTDWDVAQEGLPLVGDIGPFSTVVWHGDDYTQQQLYPALSGLDHYLAYGGRLWLMGWKPVWALMNCSGSYPYNFGLGQFPYDRLHLQGASQSPIPDFIGANGESGYPSVAIDSAKTVPSILGRLPYVDALLPRDAWPILTFNSFSGDSFQGRPVGVVWRNGYRIAFLGFPLYYTKENEARQLAVRVLTDLGEPYGVAETAALDALRPALAVRPNPAQNLVYINYTVVRSGRVRLALYNVSGRLVQEPVNRILPAGEHIARLECQGLRPGLYYLRLTYQGQGVTQKIVKAE
ncbi:MAG: M28 family peptidase [candidate division WOR-3 bacterium]